MFKIQIPDNFEQIYASTDASEVLRATFVSDNDEKITIAYYYVNGTVDKKALKSAPNSDFYNESGMEFIEQSQGDAYSSAYLYTKSDKSYYDKVYRFVHADGVAMVIASSKVNDFGQFDTICESYDKYVSLGSILGVVFVILLFAAGGLIGYSIFRHWRNKAALLTNVVISLVLLIVIIIFSGLALNVIFTLYGISIALGYIMPKYGVIAF